ncbi:hypothetical protein SAVIM338S_04560 [Streptomyces avidinii]
MSETLPLSRVSGVVDGYITTLTDPDGGTSLQIRIKIQGAAAEDCDQFEVVLEREHTKALGETLLSLVGRPESAIPCSVGVSLQTPLASRPRRPS